MYASRTRRRRLGVTLIEVMTVTGIMASLHSQSNFQYALNKANELRGLNNLRQIYTLLMVQSITGAYPAAAFYPEGDPKKDPKSIVRLIPGAPPQLFVSPFAPQALQAKGLTYAWNTAVNGKTADAVPRDTWLLLELTAFLADPNVPTPGKYFVLFADGRAQVISELPPDVVKAVNEARAKAGKTAPKKGAPPPKAPPKTSDGKDPLPKGLPVRLPGGQTIPIPPALPGL